MNQSEAEKLEGSISKSELGFALKNMTNNRSPGTSGFSCEFYKVFWNKLGDFICRALNYSYQKGELPITQRQGIITLPL